MEKLETKMILQFNPKYNMQVKNNETTGLLSVKDIKKILPCDGRIVRNAASEYEIEMISVGVCRFYDKSIIEAIQKYIGSKKIKPLSWGRSQ